ncbi:hypothetical protein JTE90_017195 [Oedothorax gibbosus]|uniref:Vesicular, overexpressed in cancer, prosurvival protein 1 n=1 Tax=Oedothorax gibbosus TaxID=931172 RepID=A0AAV6VA72_9ARAC|nr:hypothetical protein JTE90_017195 [Oedothorax gibbosus]
MGKHSDVSKFVFFTINVLILLTQVSAYYCNHDLCREDQYCCGDNLCCDYVYSPWYFWAGVVFMVVMLSACGGLFRYCYDGKAYVVLHHTPTSKGELGSVVVGEAPPAYTVAQYSDTPPSFYHQDKHTGL